VRLPSTNQSSNLLEQGKKFLISEESRSNVEGNLFRKSWLGVACERVVRTLPTNGKTVRKKGRAPIRQNPSRGGDKEDPANKEKHGGGKMTNLKSGGRVDLPATRKT